MTMFVAAPARTDPPTKPETVSGAEKPVPTFVRRRPCLESDHCITREGIDRIAAIVASERECRSDVRSCRTEVAGIASDPGGWDPSTVVLVVVGIVAAVAAGAFAVGYVAAG
jgi:hypothetical protein